MLNWKKTERHSAEKTAGAPTGLRAAMGRHASRKGAFSAGAAALAVAAAVVFNLAVGRLPDSVTQFDMTDTGIYNITQVSLDYLAGLSEDVEVHVLADRDSMDSRIVRFLDRYEDLSERLSVEYIDPAVYPSAPAKYGADTNTIVVTCAATGRQETVAIDDIIGYDQMAYYYNGTYTETDFDAEGLLTSAVDGVLTAASYAVYETAGHGETAVPNAVRELLQKSHFTLSDVNLLTDGGIPEDCALLLLNAPTKDLADDELAAIEGYLAQGGQAVYCMAGQDLRLPNLETLCADYGMTVADGMIADPQNCYQNNPYLFFPAVDNAVDAASGVYSDSVILYYASRGVTLTAPVRDGITASAFLSTSDGGCAVADENTRADGTFAVGAVATEEIDDGLTARLTVYGSDSLINEAILSSFTNLSNAELFMSSVTCGFGDVSALAIEPVSLEAPTNTIATGGLWALLFIVVIPAAALITGFARWMHRRRL